MKDTPRKHRSKIIPKQKCLQWRGKRKVMGWVSDEIFNELQGLQE